MKTYATARPTAYLVCLACLTITALVTAVLERVLGIDYDAEID